MKKIIRGFTPSGDFFVGMNLNKFLFYYFISVRIVVQYKYVILYYKFQNRRAETLHAS